MKQTNSGGCSGSVVVVVVVVVGEHEKEEADEGRRQSKWMTRSRDITAKL